MGDAAGLGIAFEHEHAAQVAARVACLTAPEER